MGLDSVEFAFELEKAFEIRLDEDKWAKVHIIKDIIELIWENCDRQKFPKKENVELKFKEVFQSCFLITDKEYDVNKSITHDFGID